MKLFPQKLEGWVGEKCVILTLTILN